MVAQIWFHFTHRGVITLLMRKRGISLPSDRIWRITKGLLLVIFFGINNNMKFRDLLRILEETRGGTPKIVKRLVSQLERKGMGVGQANAVARSTLHKSGVLKAGSDELTAKGEHRTRLGASGRAIDREARKQGKDPSRFVYSKKTNRATLKRD